jgi:hypothetical protein
MEFFRVAHEYQFESAQVGLPYPLLNHSDEMLGSAWYKEDGSLDMVERQCVDDGRREGAPRYQVQAHRMLSKFVF